MHLAAVLDLAEACDPTINAASPRQYIRQRMAAAPPAGGGGAPHPLAGVGMPNQAQLDNILQSVVAAFPGIGEAVQQIIAPIMEGVDPNGAAMPADVVENLQHTLIKPLLESVGGAGTDLMPAIGQIVEGFKSLNQALMGADAAGAAAAAGAGGGPSGPPLASGDTMMQ